MMISLILIYVIIGSIFTIVCLLEFLSIDDGLVWLLGIFWIIVLPLMIVYALLSTIVKWFKVCWK